ncbi:MAG: hypothetical protein AABM29_05575 [Actinomycetota bacterium]
MRSKRRRNPGWLAMAAVVALAAASLAIQPAFGGPRTDIPGWAKKLFFTKEEIRIGFTPRTTARKHYKKFAKKKNVYSKGEVYSKEEVDSNFVPSSGSTELSVNPSNWVAETLTPPVGTLNYATLLTYLSATGSSDFQAALTVPAKLQQKQVKIDSFELCYDTNGGTLESVGMITVEHAPGNATNLPGTLVINDETDRTDNACRTYASGGGAVAIGPDDIVVVQVTIAGGSVLVGRLTLNLST